MNPDVRGQIIGHTNGTTVNMLYKEGLQNPQFIKPPKKVIEKFTSLIIPIWKRKELLHLEIKSLSTIRNTLLPKLMSGEIDMEALMKEEQRPIEKLETA
jgi:type I restriction enzyme S subunit